MQNEIIGIVGRKGSGKSRLFAALLRGCDRLILFDPMAEHGYWCPNLIHTEDRLNDFLFKHTLDGRKTFAGRFVPQDDPREEFEPFGRMVYDRGYLTLGVEEIGLISQPNYLPKSLDKIVRLGRHRWINLVWTSQRIAEVSKRLTSATDRFYIFRHTEPRDLDALAERCGSGVAERVSELGLHDFVEFDVLSGEIVEDEETQETEMDEETEGEGEESPAQENDSEVERANSNEN
jgi:hypothetical protein